MSKLDPEDEIVSHTLLCMCPLCDGSHWTSNRTHRQERKDPQYNQRATGPKPRFSSLVK